MNTFKAPWGTKLKIVSIVFSLIFIGVPVYIVVNGIPEGGILSVLLPLTFFAAVLFTIRGYELQPSKLLVHRLLWNTEIDLTGLKSVEVDPTATDGSVRTFGNGGLFSFTGKFHNKKLGNYRAFVMDSMNSVVLKFEKKTIVISPENPQLFESVIKQYITIQN